MQNMSDEKFKKITKVRLPFDRRDPDDRKNYGIHGIDIFYILVGQKGAVQFAFTVDKFLPHIELEERPKWAPTRFSRNHFSGLDVGYHSPHPMWDGQEPMACDIIETGKCYADGSILRADEWVKEIFSVRGSHPEELLWKKMEQEYEERFGG